MCRCLVWIPSRRFDRTAGSRVSVRRLKCGASAHIHTDGNHSFLFPQPWPSVSNLAKDFIHRLLPLDPASRLSADQALRHPWVSTMAASSSMKNLHRSISQNLRQRASRSSSRCPSSNESSADSTKVGLGKLISLEGNQEQQQGRASGPHPARGASTPSN